MRENRLRTLWKSGGAAVNGWLAIPNGFSAETMAHQGWDSLTIDLQHGVVDYQAMIPMLQAISTTDTVPVVRVPWLEPSALMKALDAGAYGVICPMISTADEAARLVAYTHYAPRGTRSFGPVRALQTAYLPAAAMLNYDMDKVIGSIEKGKYADIIAVAGDPIADLHEMERVKFVMKGGMVIRNDFVPQQRMP